MERYEYIGLEDEPSKDPNGSLCLHSDVEALEKWGLKALKYIKENSPKTNGEYWLRERRLINKGNELLTEGE